MVPEALVLSAHDRVKVDLWGVKVAPRGVVAPRKVVSAGSCGSAEGRGSAGGCGSAGSCLCRESLGTLMEPFRGTLVLG